MTRPDKKITVGGLVGSIVTICAWMVHEIGGLHIPPGVEGAFVVLLTFIVSYWVNNDDLNKGKGGDNSGGAGSSIVGQMDDNEAKR